MIITSLLYVSLSLIGLLSITGISLCGVLSFIGIYLGLACFIIVDTLILAPFYTLFLCCLAIILAIIPLSTMGPPTDWPMIIGDIVRSK